MQQWEMTGLRPSWIEVEINGRKYSGRQVKNIQAAFRDDVVASGGRVLPGDEDRVWQAIKDAYPRFIIKKKKKGNGGISIPAAWSFIRFIERRMRNKGLVTPQEARRRAEICSGCPQRSAVLGCSVCKHALQLFIKPPEDLERGMPQGCQACGCYLPLKVWVPREVLGSADGFDYHPSCWMRE